MPSDSGRRPRDEEQQPPSSTDRGRLVHDGPGSETTPLLGDDNGRQQKNYYNGGGGAQPPDAASRHHGEATRAAGDGNTGGAHGDDEEQTVLVQMSTTKTVIILGAAYVGVVLGAVDASIIATLSAPISSEFHSLSLFSWLATAYLIANAACQPISGRLTDVFGRGPGLVFSNVFFAAGNLVCGLARDDKTMIAGRVIAGIGGGGMMSIANFLTSDLVPLRKRGVAQGFCNIAFGTGAMLGGLFGGLVSDNSAYGWRLAFLVQVPIVLVSGSLVFFMVNVPPKSSSRSLLSRIDFVGAFFIATFLVMLLLGLNAGGNTVPWTHPLVLSTLPLSAITLVAFVWWESGSRQPILPVRLLLDRTVLAVCLTNLLCTMAMLVMVFYIPLYVQVLGYSVSDAGLRLFFSPLGVAIASVGSGVVMKRTGRYVRLGIAALVCFSGGLALATTLDAMSPVWVPFVVFFFIGAGYGAMLTITLLACIAAVDHAQQAVVTSATYAFRSIGGTVGITIASAVYQNILKERLWARFGHLPGAAEEIARIRNDLEELKALPDGWHEGVISSFMEAFRRVWLFGLGMALVALVCVSLMRQHTLHSTLERR